MPKEDRQLGKTARSVLNLFENKPEWSAKEAANALGMNARTVFETIKKLLRDGYLVKHGTTRGAWYAKP